ncbi:MAG TPA: polyprenyl synthetase family protein [Syntrophomonadaceae bacterium]|nr:polyprenyl synthetase family protein [Syntrophomonadaceae bacterium]
MKQILQTDSLQIDRVLKYLLQTNGKMLRPRLVHLTASLHPHDENEIIDIAVAVELIHLASLIHDDIIDDSHTRRGKESLNSLWGNEVSVLTGDYLFATAFNLINQHNLPSVMENITETIQIMCSGEIKQLAMLYDYNISVEDYYDKTYRKTACLFASSCKIGALVAKLSYDKVSILEQYGLAIGYAYQIIDDILDFSSDIKLLGKAAGQDLIQGNITLPVILALQDTKYGLLLKNLLETEGIAVSTLTKIIEIIEKSNAINESLKRAIVYLQAGLNTINQLPASPIQNKLQDLGLFILDNYYSKMKDNLEVEDLRCQVLLN